MVSRGARWRERGAPEAPSLELLVERNLPLSGAIVGGGMAWEDGRPTEEDLGDWEL